MFTGEQNSVAGQLQEAQNAIGELFDKSKRNLSINFIGSSAIDRKTEVALSAYRCRA
jgi:hypothetical protein